ncbi:MAG: hypothetical protein ABUL58_04180, partial [Steroidobacter sp.]
NTVMQIVYVLAAMLAAISTWPSAVAIATLSYVTAATTIISGVDYIITYSKRAVVIHRNRTLPTHS